MNPAEFRQAGHQLIDWIADYRTNLENTPVRAQVSPNQIKQQFESTPPTDTVNFSQILQELNQVIVPGITQVQHPMHFGWFPSNSSLSSVLGDIACSGLGTLGISWESCPALTEVEEVMCDWLRQLTGLSSQWQGTIYDTASTACLTAMMVARERSSNYTQATTGLQQIDKPLTVYATGEAHSSIKKAVSLAGFGQHHVRWVDVDKHHRQMDTNHLQQLIQADKRNGFTPCLIIASSGTTAVTAFDPIDEICRIAKNHHADNSETSQQAIWVHVDAAMAGSAMLLPECRHLWQGVELADSVSWNPHKWMGTNLDCSLFYIKDSQHLIRVMSTNPSFLRSTVDGEVTQYRDWAIPLGRRFRALKLLFQLRLDGIEAIQSRLRQDIQNAQWLAQQVQQSDDWELVYPLTLQTICVRHNPPQMPANQIDQHTLNWVNKINQSGEAFVSPAQVDGQWMVRVSVGVENTQHEHVVQLWQLMQATVAHTLCD